jgi:beta-lactamase class A
MKLIATFALFALLVVAVVGGYHLGSEPQEVGASPTAALVQPSSPPDSADVPDVFSTVAVDMGVSIAAQPKLSASATLIDLDTGQKYNAGNYSQTYEAASTSKLVAVFNYIHLVELGKATLTQNIQGQSATDIIMRMIVYSDNDAWDKLNRYLRLSGEQKYVTSLGLTASIKDSNIQFSTPDMARMLQLLYEGSLMNDEHRAMVYGYMARTTVKNLIQAALPADAVVYHKYGQINGVLHDASIVQYPGHNVVLVVYTNNPAGNSTLSGAQVELIRAVTTAAFAGITKS